MKQTNVYRNPKSNNKDNQNIKQKK